MEFIDVSLLSFESTNTKHKEGYVYKKTGGRIGNDAKFCNCAKYFRRF